MSRVGQRVEEWKRKIVDLSRRNRSLYFTRTRASTLKIIQPAGPEVFDRLVNSEKPWRFFMPPDVPEPPVDNDEPLTVPLPLVEHIDTKPEGSYEELPVIPRDDEVVTDTKDGARLRSILRNLYRRSRTDFEERGVRILFFTLGILEWKEVDESDTIKSPILLVPVELKRESVNDPFELWPTDEDIVINPALAVKLAEDFKIEMPAVPDDWDSAPPTQFLNAFRIHASKYGWTVNEECWLGLFSFHKLVIYHDLNNHRELLEAHTIVRRLCGEEETPLSIEPPEPSQLDKKTFPLSSFLVADADSSQLVCIEAVKAGSNLVIQGPPGTGKSQTITNLISEFIARGKSVLFVSEKMAALEVVFQRLQKAGLRHFCLQIHSQRANKREVIQELYKTHSEQLQPKKGLTEFEARQLVERRTKLNDYVHSLHLVRQPLGWAVFDVLGQMAKLAGIPYVLTGAFDASSLSPESLDRAVQIAKQLQALWPVAEAGERFPWFGCTLKVFTLSVQAQLIEDIHKCLKSLAEMEESASHLAQSFGLRPPSDVTDTERLLCTARLVSSCPGTERQWLFNPSLQEIIAEAERYQTLARERTENTTALNLVYAPRFLSLPVDLGDRIRLAVEKLTALLTRPLLSDAGLVANRDLLVRWAEGFSSLVLDWLKSGALLQQSLGLRGSLTIGRLRQLVRVEELCESQDRPDHTWFAPVQLRNVALSLPRIREMFEKRNVERNALLSEYDIGVLDLDCKDLIDKFTGPYSSFLRYFRLSYYKSKRQIKRHRKDSKLPTSILTDLRKVQSLKDSEEHLVKEFPQYEELLGTCFRGFETDFDSATRALHNAEELLQLTEEPLEDKFIYQASALGMPSRECRQSADRIGKGIKEWEGEIQQVEAYLPPHFWDGTKTQIEDQLLEEVKEWSDGLAETSAEVCECLDAVAVTARSCDGLTCERAIADLKRLARVRTIETDFAAASSHLQAQFGSFFFGIQTAWDDVLASLQWTSEFRAHIAQGDLSETLVNVVTGKEQVPSYDNVENDLNRLRGDLERLIRYFQDGFPAINGKSLAQAGFRETLTRTQEMLDQIGTLRDWIDFKAIEVQFRECSLEGFFGNLLSQASSLEANEVPDILRKSVLQAWLNYVFSDDKCLGAFRGENHERLISEFRGLDKKHWQEGVHAVIRESNRHRPTASVVIPGGELGVLLREANKQRRHLPLRKLFGVIPNLLTQLKPCLLMSPISVSQFLDPEKMRFDLVIFDEASQLRSEDAICAVYRGKQLVVCGDNKQLPPTTFFEHGMSDDLSDETDNPDAAESFDVFDSVLDACAAVMPQRQLKWHYRSEHESLIAFSNSTFYDYSLITFPCCVQEDESLGVKLAYVPDGVYDRGGRRDNVREAEKVVHLVEEHLRLCPNYSLGIVTFSVSQADTIENLLEQFRKEHPELERYFSRDRDERLFVRNLESVQGDERDVLIFSVGYGKDRYGRLTMNFGPLNAAGGERRLNVAVTRARRKVVVVSSIRATDFDLGEVNREGVRVLHRYLDFAERGPDALSMHIGTGEFESPFEQSVAARIRSLGFEAIPQVGCSSFRIDLGVVDPSHPGRFALGVECDGASYHSSATARDRDRIRQQILKKLGWKIHRIWSPDWVTRNEIEVKRLKHAIESTLGARGEGPLSPPTQTTDGSILRDGPIVIEKKVSGNDERFSTPDWVQTYEVSNLRTPQYRRLQFHDVGARPVLKDMLFQIIECEAPIHKDLAAARLAQAWKLDRVGERMMKAVKLAWRSLSRERLLRIRGNFLWPAEESFQVNVRRPDPEDDRSRRSIEEIPPEEIALAVKMLTRDSLSIDRDKLLQYVARIFGFERTGINIERTLEGTLEQLLDLRQVVLLGGRVSFPN